MKRKARKALIDFTIHTKESYVVNWHHRAYAEVLDKFMTGEIKRLMVFMPPQHGKSELSTRRMPAKMLGDNPNLRIAVAAYSFTFAKNFNRDVRNIIDSENYNEIYPGTTLSGSKIAPSTSDALRNADEFEIVGKEGSLKSVGIGGPLTGNPVDILIIDDPYKDALQAFSPVYRERVRAWYDTVAETRLHNDSQICLTMTRWHHDDLAGTLLNYMNEGITTDKWVVVNFPAIKEEEANEVDPRNPGDPLWPEKHNLEKLQNVKAKTPTVFSSMYQGNPTPDEGNMVKEENLQIVKAWDVPPGATKAVRHFIADTAYTDKQKNDPSGVMTVSSHSGTLYIWNVQVVRKEFPEFIEFSKKYIEEHGGGPRSKFYVEPKASGKSIVQFLKRKTSLNVIEHKMIDGDKITRLNYVLPKIEAGRVVLVFGHWNKSFIDQCKGFPNLAHDEEIDLLIMAILEFLMRGKAKGYKAHTE